MIKYNVWHSQRLIQLYCGKTGQTSLTRTLSMRFGKPIECQVYNVKDIPTDYTVVQSVRNPMDRFLSFYQFLQCGCTVADASVLEKQGLYPGMSLTEVLEALLDRSKSYNDHINYRIQTLWHFDISINYIHLEHAAEDLSKALRINVKKYYHAGGGMGVKPQVYYINTQRIYDYYSLDYDILGYGR